MKRARVLLVAAIVVGSAFVPVVGSAPATAAPHGDRPFAATKTVTRTYLGADGKEQKVGSQTVTLKVDKTTNLFGRQDINVSWSGATPSSGLQGDVNGAQAGQTEYPMVLLECRGVDNAKAPAGQRVDPSTCWTHGPAERYQAISFSAWAPWRVDRYADPADRDAVAGRPASLPESCGPPAASERWVPFTAIDGTRYDYGNQSCAGLPPEDFNADQSQQVVPQNATFAPTGVDGSGTSKFDLTTVAENASLGCSSSTPCTLEAIPIMGISCDPYGQAKGVPAADVPGPDDIDRATSLCEVGGNYAPGQIATGAPASVPVTGNLWWSASNWRNRIAVPLSFAPVSNACAQVGGGAPVDVYGSEVLAEATTQWAPKFCLDPKLFKFTHVQTSEPLAQSLLNDPTSDVHAAFSSIPPATGFAGPTVEAPVAVSGFSISYNIDDEKGDAVTNLRLDPRLLAKLLTESYPAELFDRFKTGQYPYLKHNPYNITQDPEFEALNPGISVEFGPAGPATLIMPSSESNTTYALTAYIEADPEARAWLDGKPDPWGMVVNSGPAPAKDDKNPPSPNYKGLALPLMRWPLLDQTEPDFGNTTPCSVLAPAAWLPLVASPTPNLATTALDVQFAASPGKVSCNTVGDGASQVVQWVAQSRQFVGQRFVIGLTTLGEAARYDLQTAALQTAANVPDPTARFTDAGGRTFVTPTPSSLAAAASHLTVDDATQTWTVPAAKLRSDPNAYPGLMVVNADVPASGLTADEAKDYSELLTFAAGDGQVQGTGNGQLPPGYLPMTAANKLGDLAGYTKRAAAAVLAQKGEVPPIVPVPAGASNPTSSGSGSSGAVGGPSVAAGGSAPTGAASTSPAASSSAPASSGASTPNASLAAQSVKTPNTGVGLSHLLLPIILGVGLLGGLLAGGAVLRPRGRKR
jgi:hypothetical protein